MILVIGNKNYSSWSLRPWIAMKTLGLHATRVALHPEVIVPIALNVARSEDEAERQSRGEDVTVVKEEALQLETFNPDAVFEEDAAARQREEGEEGAGEEAARS